MSTISFYQEQSEYTDPADYSTALTAFPNTPEAVTAVIQKLFIHAYRLETCGVKVEREVQLAAIQRRYLVDVLGQLSRENAASLTDNRPINEREIVICRHFALMCCSVFRAKKIPARLRCGFADYLEEGLYIDHWVCEYWHEQQSRWVMIDTQLDENFKVDHNITFDHCDVPRDHFLYAGEVWQQCREEKIDPKTCGIFHLRGFPYIKNNLIKDLFSLGKIEMLPWDQGWGKIGNTIDPLSEEDIALMDKLAPLSAESKAELAQQMIHHCEEIRLPENWCWSQSPTISQLWAQENA